MKSIQLADQLAADGDAAGFIQGKIGELLFTQMLHQHRGAAVDEALGQSFMKGIRDVGTWQMRGELEM